MAVVALDITGRSPFAGGKAFGKVGPYHLLEGTAHFAVDPLHRANSSITDIELAPRDANGMVRLSADFAMLRPAEPKRGRRRVLFDVPNRGLERVFGRFNTADRRQDPSAPLRPGNGFLMRHGYTVVWCGWQADVPPTPGLMGLSAPEGLNPGGSRLKGKIFCQFQADEPTSLFMLSHRGHLPHPPAVPEDPSAVLTVRDLPGDPPREISRDEWSFTRVGGEQGEPEPSHLYMPAGFEPGRLYQLVYETRGSKVMGLGMLAVRDIVSFLKHEPGVGNPCAGDIEYAYAFGASQSGRFLRELCFLGLNEDEEGRIVLDGVISLVAGGLRGEFNMRFGQPSQDICYINPGLFPFTDTEQTDPVTGQEGGLLTKLDRMRKTPKTMFINTSSEYWRGDGGLVHTNLEGMTDAPESPSVRRYLFAGNQHGSGTFPPAGVSGRAIPNAVDYTPLLRAALDNLDRWVSAGKPPPPSSHPRLSNGTAVESHTLAAKLSSLPGVRFPPRPPRAIRLDYGPDTHVGLATVLPAVQGEEYPALVSDVDEDCNEIAGIRLPDLTVPVATNTGWKLRDPDTGNRDLYVGITGGLSGWTLPFPSTRADREASGDPRRSIEERYDSREEYLELVDEAARALVDEGYLLAEDLDGVMEQAAQRYDYFALGPRA